MKRRLQKRADELKKQQKAAAKAAQTPEKAATVAQNVASEDDLSPNVSLNLSENHHLNLISVNQQYLEMRTRAIQKLRETQNPNPYPHKFNVSISLTDYIEKYGTEGKISPGSRLEGTTESMAGRIHNIRASGQKLRFYDLHSEGKKVQIMATAQ